MSAYDDPTDFDAKEVPPGDDTPDEQITEQDDPDTTVPVRSDEVLCECVAAGRLVEFHFAGPVKEWSGKRAKGLRTSVDQAVARALVELDADAWFHVDIRPVEGRW